jgi:hypothetical protein
MQPMRLFSDGKLENDEKIFVDSCNEIKHKLLVTKYWYLKCTQCSANIDYHLSFDEPYLNYCPYCSNPKQLESWDESSFDTDAYTGQKIPTLDDCRDTPEYFPDSPEK